MVKHICCSGIAAKTPSFISFFHHPCQSELTVGETTQNYWASTQQLLRLSGWFNSTVMGMMSSVTVLCGVLLLFSPSVPGAGTQALSGGCRAPP